MTSFDFHFHRIAIPLSDKLYLCTKITFASFENHASK